MFDFKVNYISNHVNVNGKKEKKESKRNENREFEIILQANI